jgi:hypothetical protein
MLEHIVNNNPLNYKDMYKMVKDGIKSDLLEMVQKHDYSYMMSDSHSVWEAGMRYEKEIQAKIHALCAIHREDAVALMAECAAVRDEQYTDGLTHKTIYNWFSTYIG